MFTTERIIASVGVVWTVVVLLAQWAAARGTGWRDYSVRAGSVAKGVIYNFTWAMLPSHKESISLHPFEFAIGVLMHIGIFLAIARVLLLILLPRILLPVPYVSGAILWLSALCALYLLLRRILTVKVRFMSSPDDYLAILVIMSFLLAAVLHEIGLISTGAFLIVAAVVFFYMPIGKLKHVLFFFIARADYGARLGYRGTYPVKSGGND